jgi:hypothetical protein
MADGTSYTIDIEAKGVGVDATAADINQLAASLSAAEAVITPFDAALSAAERELTAAGAAAQEAADDLAAADKEFARLERSALKAERAVGKAAAKGGDVAAAKAAAEAAAAAVQKQVTAVDKARVSAEKAAAAERKLASSFKEVQRAADRSAAAMRAGPQRSFGDVTSAATAMGGSMGGLLGQVTGVVEGIGRGGKAGGLVAGLFGAVIVTKLLTAATVGLISALGAGIVKMVKMGLAARTAYGEAITKQSEKLKKNILGLFLGVKVDKLMRPMKLLAKFFDRNTASGAALAKIIEMMLNPLLDGLDKASPKIFQFFQGALVAVLDLIIVVLRARNAITKLIPKAVRQRLKRLIASIDTFDLALIGIKSKLKAVAVGVLIMVAPFLLLGAALAIVVVGLFLLGKAIAIAKSKARALFDTLVEQPQLIPEALKAAGKAMFDFFERITDPAEIERQFKAMVMSLTAIIADFAQGLQPMIARAGKAMIDGLVQAIEAGMSPFAKALVSLAKGGIQAFKDAMEIKSPSGVMRKEARELPRGAEQGIEDGTDGVQDAMERMMAPDRAKKAAEDKGRAPARGGRAQAQAGPTTIYLNITAPTGDGEDIARAVQQALTRLLEATVGQVQGFVPQEAAGA